MKYETDGALISSLDLAPTHTYEVCTPSLQVHNYVLKVFYFTKRPQQKVCILNFKDYSLIYLLNRRYLK